jgi:hypothetical protein
LNDNKLIPSKKHNSFILRIILKNNSREVQSAENDSFVIPTEFRGIVCKFIIQEMAELNFNSYIIRMKEKRNSQAIRAAV